MAHDKTKDEMALAAQSPQQLSIRASLVSRGLKEISESADTDDMYTWLAKLPPRSILLGLRFQDGSELPSDNRDMNMWSKHISEMSQEERQRRFMEERCSGLRDLSNLEDDMKEGNYVWRGYIEVEGIHPFERSLNLDDENEKYMLLSAIGILIRRLLVGRESMRIYCDGDTLLRFLSDDLKDVKDLIQQVNSELRKTVVRIRKPEGTIAKRQSGLYLELTEHHMREKLRV